ncbi:MAG TPA: NAD(P)/FAD-dependent oxidoreductase [Vicinamibacterales bacterium]|jgi:flavin-dependent dehydrogenase
MRVDAVVVGARCAGAATAMLLARSGARVMLVDKGLHGTDTLSTHALMRGAVLQLHRWGLLPSIVAAGTPAVRSTTFSYSEHDVVVPIEPRSGIDALYAPRRALLDRTLVNAAEASGVDVRYGVRVDDVILDDRGRVRGITAIVGGVRHRIEADIVVGADGLHSTIAQRVGAANTVEGRHATGVLYSYWENLSVDGYYWRFRPNGSIGAIPTNDGATCVFASIPSERFQSEIRHDPTSAYRRLIRDVSPVFEARLYGARRVEPVRGFGGQAGFIKQAFGPGWALVGDAGYFKDPLTAHGITDALRDAELLARAIVQETPAALAEYETTRHDLSLRLFELTDDIASFAWTDDELQSLHRDFSREMSREVKALTALEPLACHSPSASAPHVA